MKKFARCLLPALALLLLAPGMVFAQSMEMTSAKLYIQQNEWDKAITWLQEAIKKKPDNAEAHYLLAQGYGMKGKFAEMVAEFGAVKQYDKKNKHAKDMANFRQKYFAESFNAGVAAFNNQNFDQAAEKFSLAGMIDPSQTAAFQNLVIAYRQVDRDLGAGLPCDDCVAEREWDAAAKLCRDKATGAAVKFCCCPEAKEQLDAAIVKTYQDLMAMQPDSVMHHLMLAEHYRVKSQTDKNLAVLTVANEKFPNNPRVLSEIALAYDYMGKSDEAFKMYEQALSVKPEDKDLRYNYGRLYLLRAEAAGKAEPMDHMALANAYSGAIEQFTKVLGAEPDDFDSNYHSGFSHLKIGEDYEKQISEMEDNAKKKKAKVDDAKVTELRNKGKEHFAAAIPFLEKATQIKPEQAPAWVNLGVGYARTGANAKAEAAFAKAKELEKEGN